MNPLDTLTKEQREAAREKICQAGVRENISPLVSERLAIAAFPEPEPIMVPLDDVLPLLEVLRDAETDLKHARYGSSYIRNVRETFHAKHADKMGATS